MPPELLATHAADRRDVGRGRVGAELAAVLGEHAVDVAEDRARAGRGPRAAVLEHLDPAPVVADVDEDAVALALAVEARAAGAEA